MAFHFVYYYDGMAYYDKAIHKLVVEFLWFYNGIQGDAVERVSINRHNLYTEN